MKRQTLLAASGLVLLAPALASAEGLLEVYQQALQSDPQVREAEANRLAAEEAAPQARGALLPQLTASGSFQDSDSEGNSVFLAQAAENDTRGDTTSWQVDLTQTVFRWDQYVELKTRQQTRGAGGRQL